MYLAPLGEKREEKNTLRHTLNSVSDQKTAAVVMTAAGAIFGDLENVRHSDWAQKSCTGGS